MNGRVSILTGAVAAMGSIAVASPASASTLLFTYVETGPGAIEVSWDQSSNPTPIAYNYNTYTTVPVSNWMGNIGPYSSITYVSVVFENGGFLTPDAAINVYGQQYYGFPESSPSFAPNVWNGVNATDGLPFTLTITAVPEPSAWLLMLLGFGSAALALRLDRRNTCRRERGNAPDL